MCSCNKNKSGTSCITSNSDLYNMRSLGVRAYNRTMNQEFMDFILEIDSILYNIASGQCPEQQYIDTLKNYIESEYKKLN
jgi:hypothetical protein